MKLVLGVLFLLASTVFSQGKVEFVTDGQNSIVGAIKGSELVLQLIFVFF
jgi:hypothetical protein